MTFQNIIDTIKANGGEIHYNSYGKHNDKDLGKLVIDLNLWRFNAWFNVRTNSFHTPCYNNKGYRGLITDTSIENGINEMLKKTKYEF